MWLFRIKALWLEVQIIHLKLLNRCLERVEDTGNTKNVAIVINATVSEP
jgi:hypothetical protein